MALAINIDDLLNKQKIESNRIEFKKDGIRQAYTIVYVHLPMILTILVVVI